IAPLYAAQGGVFRPQSFIAKLDATSQKVLWSTQLADKNCVDCPVDVAAIAANGSKEVVVTGYFSGTIVLNAGNDAGAPMTLSTFFDSFYLIGLDADSGRALWGQVLDLSEGSGGGSVDSIAVDPTDQGFVIAGNAVAAVTWGTTTTTYGGGTTQ